MPWAFRDPSSNPSFSTSQLYNLGKSDNLLVPQFLHPLKDCAKEETVFGQVNNSTNIYWASIEYQELCQVLEKQCTTEFLVTQLVVINYKYNKYYKGRVYRWHETLPFLRGLLRVTADAWGGVTASFRLPFEATKREWALRSSSVGVSSLQQGRKRGFPNA